jgi:MFS family permease
MSDGGDRRGRTAEHKAEAFTWLGTLYGTGLAIGAALSGQLITAIGTRAALAAACGATLLTWLLTTARAATLQPSRQPTGSPPTTAVGADDR